MKIVKRSFLAFPLLLSLFFPANAMAVCPLCTVAVAGGLGISRWLGIDDSITGIWIGGLIISSSLWMADWIRKRGWKIPYPEVSSFVVMLLFVVPPLMWSKMIGIPGNMMWGFDKILLGIFLGIMVFLIGVKADKWLRTQNEDKVFIYYQKVIVPVFLLSLTSFIFYLITG